MVHVGTVHECDRRTDGQTVGWTDRFTMTKTSLCIASHGKKTRAVLSPGNRAKPCKFRYVVPYGRYSERKRKLAFFDDRTRI